MNSTNPPPADPPLDGRLHFVKHKGHAIYVIDFSHCTAKEILLLLDMIRADISQHPPASLLSLADFTGAHIDKEVATKAKKILVLDRPYIKKSAWVGTKSLPHVYYENFKSFSQRDLPTFNTREEAMEWLVEE
jgi:hypothetical protein